MIGAMKLTLFTSALACLSLSAARADHEEYIGRTGLLTVREGKNEVWMERGVVSLAVRGGKLHVTQEYKLTYPGPPVENGAERVKVAVREDYFRDKAAGEMTKENATTFDSFAVLVDGKAADAVADSWMLNDKKDTATRWHNIWLAFNPGESHTVRVDTVAPIGWNGTNRYIHLVSKDLGGFRKDPDYLEIRFEGPEKAGPIVATLEPKPTDRTMKAASWVYKGSNPKRDVLIKLPTDYKPESG